MTTCPLSHFVVRHSLQLLLISVASSPCLVLGEGTEELGPPNIPIRAGNQMVAAGAGTADGTGVIVIDVPATAAIRQVLLYWSGAASDVNPLTDETDDPRQPNLSQWQREESQVAAPYGHAQPERYDRGEGRNALPSPTETSGVGPAPAGSSGPSPFETQSAVAGDSVIVVNGIAVLGTRLGDPIPFTGNQHNLSYRADITGLGLVRRGANVLNITEMDFDLFNDGVGVLVIYDLGNESATIGIRDGIDSAFAWFTPPLDTTVPQTFTFDAHPLERTADLVLFVGDVDVGRLTEIDITVDGVTTTLQNPLGSFDGLEWDTFIYPVVIPAGATDVTVQVLSKGNGNQGTPASIMWVMAALRVPLPGTEDCNNNDVPDLCDVSCANGNGSCEELYPNLCGLLADCNANDVPDECELAGQDCNSNGILDACEPGGALCDDGDLCTVDDVCVDGACVGAPRDCSAFDDTCTEGACDPVTGECYAASANDGTTCDDGNPCTDDDFCSNGVCAGYAADCSDLDTECTTGVCNPATGACEAVASNEGGACSDENLCTIADACSSGLCVGEPVDCSSLDDACLVGVCDPADGMCYATPANEGGICDDGNGCTVNDQCTDGVCSGEPLDCSHLDDGCNLGVCVGTSGVCVAEPAADGAACNDGDLCTDNDTCSNGVCAGTAVDCSALDDLCLVGVCVPATGQCAAEPVSDDTPCDDSDLCTTDDACVNGACVGDAIDCTHLDDMCNQGVCDPASGSCMTEPAFEGLGCDDADACTEFDVCSNGVCAGEAVDCSYLDDACVVGACIGSTGLCEALPANDGATCDDGDVCTEGDSCSNGFCTGSLKDCTALDDACNIGLCDPVTGDCVPDPANEGGLCDDGNDCTLDDQCVLGECLGEPVDCSHLDDACNLGTCVGTTGICEAEPANEGGGCDDFDLCTVNDTCSNGACAGTPRDCSHLDDQCVVGVCDPQTGACTTRALSDGEACDDGNGCTVDDTCELGVCGGVPQDCSALDDACNIGICIGTTGICVAEPTNEGGLCDDGDGCTVNDTCASGVCTGERKDCSAFDDACNEGMCVGTTGVCVAMAVDDGLACDDGDGCTIGDQCIAGACVSDPVDCSALDDACNIGVCIGTSGVCAPEPVNEGGLCDDGDLCTLNDACSNGSCVATPVDCSYLDDGCNVGVCNPLTGQCTVEPVNEGGACDDGNDCTVADTCQAGACVGSSKDCSAFDDACNLGVCIGTSGVCAAEPANEGGICDDGNGCTLNDACSNGVCVGLDKDCSALDDACNEGVCVGTTGVCAPQPINNGGVCDDGDGCTVDDVCAAGDCSGEPMDCSFLDDDCSLGVCVGTSGVCVAEPVNEGGTCSDGDECTIDDTCSNGVCAGDAKDCSVLDDACHVGVCAGTSGLCVAEPSNEGGFCDDGDGCTVNDACSNGACAGTPKDCSALDDACNVGVCMGTSGVCEAEPTNGGGTCDDGNACTVDDTCSNGVCTGAPLDCSYLDGPCTVGVCLGTSGVCTAVPANEGQSCDDDNGCTVGDACSGGTCAGTPMDCSDFDDACNVGVCVGTTGVCAAEPVNEGGACDDGDNCTVGDMCASGTCVSTPKDCSALDDACNVGVCVGTSGVCAAEPTNEGNACDDGDGCTLEDACSNGVCAGEPLDCTHLDDQCNVGVCNPALGTCEAEPTNEGNTCDDGINCTTGDLCSNGICGGEPMVCPPGQHCDEDLGACTSPLAHRVGAARKGSLLVFSKVEVRWNASGELIQDTFLDLTNDYPGSVHVQMYFIHGDPPMAADPPERAHLGWNWVDVQIQLTGNQPTYWSVHEGLPAAGGVAPFTVLDPGSPPGRPDPERPGQRIVRGYVLAWAVDEWGHEIRWNHLAGDAIIVDYDHGTAWEYGAFAYQVVDPAIGHGQTTGSPGELHLDGVEYDHCFEHLLFDFKAVDVGVYSSADTPTTTTTHLTLHPVSVDLRQEGDGPVTTKATFAIWNMNEVKLTGLDQCITCWDQRLLSSYGIPNHFLRQNLQTDVGHAQIQGVASNRCHQDTDGDGVFDVLSVDAALLGVSAEEISFLGPREGDEVLPDRFAAPGGNLHGMGTMTGLIRADVQAPTVPEKTEAQED